MYSADFITINKQNISYYEIKSIFKNKFFIFDIVNNSHQILENNYYFIYPDDQLKNTNECIDQTALLSKKFNKCVFKLETWETYFILNLFENGHSFYEINRDYSDINIDWYGEVEKDAVKIKRQQYLKLEKDKGPLLSSHIKKIFPKIAFENKIINFDHPSGFDTSELENKINIPEEYYTTYNSINDKSFVKTDYLKKNCKIIHSDKI